MGRRSHHSLSCALCLPFFFFAFAITLGSALTLETPVLLITLPLVPLMVLVLVLSWVVLSANGHVPTPLTPAGLSGRLTGGITVWLGGRCGSTLSVVGAVLVLRPRRVLLTHECVPALRADKTCVDQSNVAGFLERGIDSFMLQ
jgi:hypothetical protein